ncbi:MAG: hypothetical protein COU63_00675 [Candidatus Pacebacteria bacterium CG10_big_fil_rev_8_21_14_0_10_36_11]|nr:GGDEF domain-containing protein [Candidatus Pacearchaeota archaeon]OIP74541.1 MAG: hypothetical protein AUK08_00270 [Candidatus Pacebacteria bacterium CG2_30_36_39]PIR65167.1 MAG: hypothetical protein COU63_00675 [Candidatus Pacebacteria bacterium CG10_big_fil_rev_8_21_14_0_10_36_11]
MNQEFQDKQTDATETRLSEKIIDNFPGSESLDVIYQFFVNNEKITLDDYKLGLSPDEEFFISELTRLIGVEFSQNGLDFIANLANQKINLAASKFFDQPKSEKMITFLAFLFNEFKDAKTESEKILEVYFSLLARVIRLEKVNTAFEVEQVDLRKVASTDSLTKINNRGQLEADLPMIFDSDRESDQNLALIIFDLDHFKAVNDTYGHAAGDMVLRAVTKRIAELIRNEDKFYRYGGEEFVILLQVHNRDEVKLVMNKIVESIAEMPIDIGNGRELKITLSMGGAIKEDALNDDRHGNTHKAWVLMQLADEVLYHVKHRQNGRNDSFMIGLDTMRVDFTDQMWDEVGKNLKITDMIKSFFLGFLSRAKPKKPKS